MRKKFSDIGELKPSVYAALLLFGKQPQRFFISSEVRCVVFSGTKVEKPIPSYKVFKGTAFDLVDQIVEYILSKLDYDEKYFRESYQQEALKFGVLEMTIPDKPNSRNQKYRLTKKGLALQKALQKKK